MPVSYYHDRDMGARLIGIGSRSSWGRHRETRPAPCCRSRATKSGNSVTTVQFHYFTTDK
jgi:hypothetical protein